MYFHVYLIYRFTRTFTNHSSVITRCWGFELQNGKSSLKSPQTLVTQDFAPASFLSTPDKNKRQKRFIAYKASKSKPFEGFHDEKWKPFSRRFIRVKASLRQDSNLQVRTFMSGALFRTEKMKKGATQNTIKGMS